MRDYTKFIAGESIEDLCDGLRGLKLRKRADGSATGSGTIGPAVVRAMMRFEAELLIADADAMAKGTYVERTPPQRRHDAMLELMRAIVAHQRSLAEGHD